MVSWVNAAWRRAGMTMVCRVAALAADWSDLALIVLGGVGCGCALFAIAGAVYGWRMSRLPAWARARLSPQPNAASVWTAIALLLVTGVSIVVF